MKLTITQIVIVALVIALLAREGCNGCTIKRQDKRISALEKGCGVLKVQTLIDTSYLKDTVYVPVYVPQPYQVIVEKPVPIPYEKILHDTVKVFEQYTAKVTYRDSFKTKYGGYEITDTLQFNRIAGRSISGSERVPLTTVTKLIEKPVRNQVWVGIGGMYQDKTIYPTASLMFAHKRGIAYEALVGYQKGFTYGAGVKWKIKF